MKYFLVVIIRPYTNKALIKILYEPSIWQVYERYDLDTHTLIEIKDITNLTIEEVEEYCERYNLCILR